MFESRLPPNTSLQGLAWLAALMFSHVPVAMAATWYVDAAVGDDGNDGKHASTTGGQRGPFKTAAPLSALPMQAGDQVLFKCGQRHLGPVRLRLQPGAGEGFTRLTGFGVCVTPPKLVGDRQLLGANESNKIPQGELTHQMLKPVTRVWFGQKPVHESRYPATGWHIWKGMEPDFAVEFSPSRGNALPGDVNGAQLHVRSQEWHVETSAISTHERQGALTASPPLRYPIRPGVGIYVTGKKWMLDSKVQSWAYDRRASNFHVNCPATECAVTYATDEPVLDVRGAGSLELSGVDIERGGADGIRVDIRGVAKLSSLRVSEVAGNGVALYGLTHATIHGSNISNTGLDGIFFAEVKHAEVHQNKLQQIGMFGHPGPTLAAINAHRTLGATITDNWIDGTSYIGIRYSGNAQVKRNVLLNTCSRLSDCAAIYTWRRNEQHIMPPSEVSNNIVMRVSGDTTVKLGVTDWFAGIYLDEYSRSHAVRNNWVIAANQGIYLHNAVGNQVEGNYLINSWDRPLVVAIDPKRYTTAEIPGNIVGENFIDAGLSSHKNSTLATPSSDSSGWVVHGVMQWRVAFHREPDAVRVRRDMLPGGCTAVSHMPITVAPSSANENYSTAALLKCVR